MRVREYRLQPGGSLNCIVAPEDDFVIAHVHAPLRTTSPQRRRPQQHRGHQGPPSVASPLLSRLPALSPPTRSTISGM